MKKFSDIRKQKKAPFTKKAKPPVPDREKGDRAAKGLTPPFHDDRDIKSYRSWKDDKKIREAKERKTKKSHPYYVKTPQSYKSYQVMDRFKTQDEAEAHVKKVAPHMDGMKLEIWKDNKKIK